MQSRSIAGTAHLHDPLSERHHGLQDPRAARRGVALPDANHRPQRRWRKARAVRSGQVFIDDHGAGGGVELPFGGVGASGRGREKGFEAPYGFATLKTIAIHHG